MQSGSSSPIERHVESSTARTSRAPADHAGALSLPPGPEGSYSPGKTPCTPTARQRAWSMRFMIPAIRSS